MKTYIWKKQEGFYVDFPEEIDATYWEGLIGSTYEDFLNDKWILLNNDLLLFHELYPTASVREVLNMEIDPISIPDPVEEAKNLKLAQLSAYDSSANINDFIVNGELHAWFSPEIRSNYRNSIDAAKLLNINTLEVFINDNLVTLSTQDAELMLAAILLYADLCFIKTKQHAATIESLNSVEAINNYDFTLGYPAKLNFSLTI